MTDLRVVPLDTGVHDRRSFRCGHASLDRYLQRQAGQDLRAKANAVFVMVVTDNPATIVGFYTLCGVGVDPGEVAAPARRRLPRYPQVSATLLGRFAIAASQQRMGLGGILLVDALRRAFRAAEAVGSTMVVTDPIDEVAATFYHKHGFRRLEGVRRMFIMMETIGAMIVEAGG